MSPDEEGATAPEETADTYHQNINAGQNADGANGTQGDRAGEGGDGQTAGYASAYPTYNERGWPNTLKLRRPDLLVPAASDPLRHGDPRRGAGARHRGARRVAHWRV
jgi:hypothetical protein